MSGLYGIPAYDLPDRTILGYILWRGLALNAGYDSGLKDRLHYEAQVNGAETAIAVSRALFGDGKK